MLVLNPYFRRTASIETSDEESELEGEEESPSSLLQLILMSNRPHLYSYHRGAFRCALCGHVRQIVFRPQQPSDTCRRYLLSQRTETEAEEQMRIEETRPEE